MDPATNLRNDEARCAGDSGGRPTSTLIEHNTVGFTPSAWVDPDSSRIIGMSAHQVMPYKYFLDRMISMSRPFPWNEFWRSIFVDPCHNFSDTWRGRVDNGRRRDATTEMLHASCINDLVDIWNSLLATYQPSVVDRLILKLVSRGESNQKGPRASRRNIVHPKWDIWPPHWSRKYLNKRSSMTNPGLYHRSTVT